MRKDSAPIKSSREPLLGLTEFEELAGTILDLTKDQTFNMIQEANQKRDEVIKEAKGSFSILEKECLEKTEEEIKLEKDILISRDLKEELKRIASIPAEKVKEAAQYILEKVLPKEAF